MSSCDLIFKLEQETDKLKTVIFQLYFRVIIRPSDLQKLTKLYIYIYIYIYVHYNCKNDVIGYQENDVQNQTLWIIQFPTLSSPSNWPEEEEKI